MAPSSTTSPRRVAMLAALLPALLLPSAALADPTPRPHALHGEVSVLARGVTHERITLGDPGARYDWTLQVTLPSGEEGVADSPVSSAAIAAEATDRLRGAGLDARSEEVVADELEDAGGPLGERVRVGSYATEAEASRARGAVIEAGYPASVWYEGWDGDAPAAEDDGGPVAVNVLTVDPARFRGEVGATFGADLERTETTSELAAGALAGVNGGFFVYGAQHGAPGDPAGAAAYDGEVLSESVGDRPALVLDGRRGRAAVQRLTWSGRLSHGLRGLDLDGIDRVPGLIRNCGGADDLPTSAPQHDVTCTDADELVAFTEEFGASTPEGEGLEVVLDAHGRVRDVLERRGTALGRGERSVQATGAEVAPLRELAEGARRLHLTSELADPSGRRLPMTPSTQVISGGPNLVTDGSREVTAARDGMVLPANPGQFYGWVHQRNPRTIAGVDARGRLMLVTVDGRQTESVGMSISEAADLALDLGLVDAVNLDGGGSTTMVVGDELVSSPSGGQERAVGDALVIRGR